MLDSLEKKLNSIRNKMDILTREPSNDFVDDYITYTSFFSDEYKQVYDNFWNYFRNKYDLPEIKDFFDNSYVLLGRVFEECIKPFYLRLDILPEYNDKYKKMTVKYKVSWYFSRLFSNNWLTIISIVLMLASLIYSNILEDKNSFKYDISMSLGTGSLIALIIGALNSTHRKKVRKKVQQMNTIAYQYNRLKESYEKMNEMLKQGIEEKETFVTRFCVMNNSLNDFLKRTKEITALQTIDIYHRLFEFEKEIFNYSKKIVQKPFEKYRMDNTTVEEIGVLQKYIIQLGYWLSHFEWEITDLKYYYEKDITKMEDKSL